MRVRYLDGRVDEATIVEAQGKAGEPLRYAVRFACGCELSGIAPERVEAVYSDPVNGPSEGSKSAEPPRKRPSRYRATR